MNMEKTTMWQNVALEIIALAYLMLPIAYYILH